MYLTLSAFADFTNVVTRGIFSFRATLSSDEARFATNLVVCDTRVRKFYHRITRWENCWLHNGLLEGNEQFVVHSEWLPFNRPCRFVCLQTPAGIKVMINNRAIIKMCALTQVIVLDLNFVQFQPNIHLGIDSKLVRLWFRKTFAYVPTIAEEQYFSSWIPPSLSYNSLKDR